MIYKSGDVLLTRYIDEKLNGFPGYWNHVAIINHSGYVVESLMKTGVIKTNINDWFSGVEHFCLIRYKDPHIAYNSGKYVNNYIGKKYRMMTSLFRIIGNRRINMGLNCVSLVRLGYRSAMNRDPGWFIPDDIFNDIFFDTIIRNDKWQTKKELGQD